MLKSSVRRFFYGVSRETNGCVMKLIDNLFRSCAHDSCRWYQDYRNEKKKQLHSISKQFLQWYIVSCGYFECVSGRSHFSTVIQSFPDSRVFVLLVSSPDWVHNDYFTVTTSGSKRGSPPLLKKKMTSTVKPRYFCRFTFLFRQDEDVDITLCNVNRTHTIATLATGGTFAALLIQ